RIELAEPGEGPKPDPEMLPLTLPRVNSKIGESRMYKDLTAHPWAGLDVRMTIIARDQAGQEGASEPVTFVLPARRFTKPLAKALVEQRRKLVRAPAEQDRVAKALDALAIAPEKFIDDAKLYLALRSVYWRLRQASTPKAIESVVEQLWQLALAVEDGDVPEAEAALRQAQERLQQALEDGAPDAEIQKLLQELRQALSNFLQALAQQAQRNGLTADPRAIDPQKMLSSQDLDQLLKNIENLAKTGARDLAKQMLSELRNLMERLQMGAMSQNPEANRMMNMVDGLGDIITRQQGLLDDTFQSQRRGGGQQQGEGQQGKGQKQGQGQGHSQGKGQQGQGGQPGQQGRPGEGGEPGGFAELSRRQGEIRKTLDGLLEQLRSFGLKPPDQLEGAARAMNDAEKALQENNLDRATQQQTLALDRLRQGTQSLAQQVLQGMAVQLGQGTDAPRDPFGRPERTQGPDLGTSVKVPDEIDIQRAREILEELRRRLSEPTRPLIELDYLERLLRQF
ncbi:MAG: TIGR02302 family protein, partial [Pseudomonadota bacterium]|nr:TIGR02302 family protein [Pseudomonadota bacterium]